MDLRFSGELWHWRGPSPYHFITVPEQECSKTLKAISARRHVRLGHDPRRGPDRWTSALDHVAVPQGRPILRSRSRTRCAGAEQLELGDVVDSRAPRRRLNRSPPGRLRGQPRTGRGRPAARSARTVPAPVARSERWFLGWVGRCDGRRVAGHSDVRRAVAWLEDGPRGKVHPLPPRGHPGGRAVGPAVEDADVAGRLEPVAGAAQRTGVGGAARPRREGDRVVQLQPRDAARAAARGPAASVAVRARSGAGARGGRSRIRSRAGGPRPGRSRAAATTRPPRRAPARSGRARDAVDGRRSVGLAPQRLEVEDDVDDDLGLRAVPRDRAVGGDLAQHPGSRARRPGRLRPARPRRRHALRRRPRAPAPSPRPSAAIAS